MGWMQTNHVLDRSPTLYRPRISSRTKVSLSTISRMYKLGPPTPASGSKAFPKSTRCNLDVIAVKSCRMANSKGSVIFS